MKKILLLLLFGFSFVASHAQTVYICKDGDYTTQSLSEGYTLNLSDLPDSITFSKPQITPVVTIVYSGTTATVTIPAFLSNEVTCSSGTSSQVIIVNTNTTDEITYNVSGSSTAGSLTITSDYKMTVNLNGVSLTSTKGEAMRFKCGKRIALVMADGTTNTFADTADNGSAVYSDDTHKACIYTKGHIELSGAGTLNVSGNYNHAIASKEYFQIKKTVTAVNIVKAANDAIHAGQYFQMNGGTLTINSSTVNDGVQAEYKTDDNDAIIVDEENTGGVIIKGGTLNITMNNSEDAKGIKAEGNIDISGGTFTIDANANGSRGIQTDGNMTISQADATTNMTITAAGGKCTLEEDSDDPHKCMGIKVDGNLTIDAGTITVYNTGKKSKGIKVSGIYTNNGGTVTASIDND
ncbi:MAG: carbohydrate-binding domain-containing protein [Bacteroidaceae bacterium]|nr:carbohydrate-binding domain-containing protein [Bacteroidaceae bacterium]